MNVAFVVKIKADEVADLEDTANEIRDSLAEDGFEVIDVKAWSRPGQESSPGIENG
jgi:hypothetical protein